jgi:hypothetical protein
MVTELLVRGEMVTLFVENQISGTELYTTNYNLIITIQYVIDGFE